jgi:hypothetical protein
VLLAEQQVLIVSLPAGNIDFSYPKSDCCTGSATPRFPRLWQQFAARLLLSQHITQSPMDASHIPRRSEKVVRSVL